MENEVRITKLEQRVNKLEEKLEQHFPEIFPPDTTGYIVVDCGCAFAERECNHLKVL